MIAWKDAGKSKAITNNESKRNQTARDNPKAGK